MAIGKVHPGEDAKIDASGTRVVIMKDADTGNIIMPVVETDPTRAQRVAPYVWDPATGAFVVMTQPEADILANYFATDFDESGDPAYYGFLDKDGNWVIMEVNETNGTVRYDSGSSAYTTAWTGRAGLTYNYFDVEF